MAATIVSTLYPPLIDTFMPAFPYEGPAPVSFSFSPYNSLSEIKRIHVSLVNQKTNQSAFKNNAFTLAGTDFKDIILYDNIWIIPFNTNNSEYYDIDVLNNTCTIKIPRQLLKTDNSNFTVSNYYKVQIRLDNCPLSNGATIDSTYLQEKRQYFSEWSSVCLIKAIPKVELGMIGFDNEFNDIIDENIISNIRKVQAGIVPIAGSVIFTVGENITNENTQTTTEDDIIIKNAYINTKDSETLQRYKISIIADDTGETIDKTANWIYTTNNIDPNRIYWLANLTNAEPDTTCTLVIEIITKNQYYFKKEYQIRIASFDAIEFTPKFIWKTVKLDKYESVEEKITTEEDGTIEFTITSVEELPQGFLYVTRATSLDNYKNWELISCTENNGRINKTFIDSTIGSLVTYRYACQYRLKKSGAWTRTYQSQEVYPDFYDMFIYRNGRQIALRYNTQITGYTSVVNRQVINTLGSKYPKFAENAHMNYKKFTISGLITSESDFNRKFLNDRDYAYEMNQYDKNMDGKYEVRNDTLPDDVFTYTKNIRGYESTYEATRHLTTLNHDLAPKDNWWFERQFREEALAWLNDGEPKLLRSMTEGNLVVMLTDISLTPNTQVGRRTYNISMTAYEVGDGYSLDVLSSLGIINIPNEYSDYINAGMGPNQEDEDDSDDGTIEENLISQIYQKTATNSNLIADGDGTKLINKPDLNSYTLDNYYNGLYYRGANSNYRVVDGSYRLKDLKIQFTSFPQWYDITDIKGKNLILEQDKDGKKLYENIEIKETKNNKEYIYPGIRIYTDSTKSKFSEVKTDNLIYGYKLGLKVYDGDKNPTKTIFIEEKGYYQVPSNLIIEDIILYDNAVATLDFKLTYKREYDESSVPTEAEITQKIVGQLSGKWYPNQNISASIKNKYEYYQTSDTEKEGYNGLLEKQYLDKITAFGFDGTTYTMLNITFEGDRKSQQFLVGRTGVYNLMTDYPITEATFLGRRMFRKDNFDYVDNRDNVFILDPSTASYQGQPIDNWNWYDLDTNKVLDVLVVINGNISTPEVNQIVRNMVDWETEHPYNSVNEIDNPSSNTIYGVLNEESNTVLMIYKNNQWTQVEMTMDETHTIVGIDVNEDLLNSGKKKFFLDDWEYSLDESAEDEHNSLLLWYKTYAGQTDDQVIINGETDINTYIRDINGNLVIPAIDGYLSTNDIKSPDYNIIYGFKDGDNKKYKIYYIDQNWYDVEFINSDKTLILAKVPVYGMVNYRGNLVRIKYI